MKTIVTGFTILALFSMVGCAGMGTGTVTTPIGGATVEGSDNQEARTNYGRYIIGVKNALEESVPGKTTITGLGNFMISLAVVMRKENLTKKDIEAAVSNADLKIETTQEMKFDIAKIQREPTGHEIWSGALERTITKVVWPLTMFGIFTNQPSRGGINNSGEINMAGHDQSSSWSQTITEMAEEQVGP
jgi:hypothetical protein